MANETWIRFRDLQFHKYNISKLMSTVGSLAVQQLMNTWERCQTVDAHHHLEQHHYHHDDYCSSAQWKQTYSGHYVSQLSYNESRTETKSVSQSQTSFNCSRNGLQFFKLTLHLVASEICPRCVTHRKREREKKKGARYFLLFENY